eukprot:751648-Hanusia_phi.AAC.5
MPWWHRDHLRDKLQGANNGTQLFLALTRHEGATVDGRRSDLVVSIHSGNWTDIFLAGYEEQRDRDRSRANRGYPTSQKVSCSLTLCTAYFTSDSVGEVEFALMGEDDGEISSGIQLAADEF